MRTLLHFLVSLVAVGLLAGPAAASHLQGGDLTYVALGNNQYRVTLHAYRDCSGIVPSPFTLECRNSGCNTPSVISVTMTQVGTPVTGQQYCATLSGVCTATGPTNSEAYTYQATVTLPPAARWVLSTTQSARPVSTNLVGANSSDLYLEATLNNLVTATGTTGVTITNNSPVAVALPVAYLPVNRTSNISNSSFDSDGDSLVYALASPLVACGMPATYAPYPVTPQIILTTNPLCVLQTPTITQYSPILPIAVAYDTTGTCPLKTGTPLFRFNASTGNIMVHPSRYFTTPSAAGDNKYAAVVKITEYRRINGQYVEVGSVRRDLYFVVYDCGTNIIPRLGQSVTVQGGASQNVVQPLDRIIPVAAGETVSVLVNASDANVTQALTMSLDYNAAPGTALQALGNGQARVSFTPPAGLPQGLYRVAVTAEDDACPIKGHESKILTFRVTARVLAARTGAALAVPAYPNPFTDQVQFKLATPGVQTLVICDNLGRTVATVRSQADGTVNWQPAANIPAGLYLARTAGGSQTVRLLRNAAQ